MIQRRSKILPKGGASAWIIRREQERQHVDQTKHAGCTNQDPKRESQTDSKFPLRYEKRTELRMRQHEAP